MMSAERFRNLINSYVKDAIYSQELLDHEREWREDSTKTYEAKQRAMKRHPELQCTGRPNADFIDDISEALSVEKGVEETATVAWRKYAEVVEDVI